MLQTKNGNGGRSYASNNRDESYHQPRSVGELTQHNVEAIAALERAADASRKPVDLFADAITRFCGTMAFVYVHVLWFGLWITWNLMHGTKSHHFDPFPFQLLTLTVSLEAIFLSAFLLISQNRQGHAADRRNHLDLQINLLSEQENTKILTMLGAICEKLGIDDGDPELSILEEATRPEQMIDQIERTLEHVRRDEKAAHKP